MRQRGDGAGSNRVGFIAEQRNTARLHAANTRVTMAARAREKIRRTAKKLLHREFNALNSRLPNFARACGRVPVGGHPDKRPDSRPE
jgi:hypothetical protein